MKVAVTSTGLKIDDRVGVRLDKCSHWLIVDPATLEYKAIINPLTDLVVPLHENFWYSCFRNIWSNLS